jgi:hypothetical protein
MAVRGATHLLVGKERTRTPIVLHASGPPMLLCYSVAAGPDGALHTTIMRDTNTSALRQKTIAAFACKLACCWPSRLASIRGACMSVPPPQNDKSGSKLILSLSPEVKSSPFLIETDGDGFVTLGGKEVLLSHPIVDGLAPCVAFRGNVSARWESATLPQVLCSSACC